jgi:hypothetical protein
MSIGNSLTVEFRVSYPNVFKTRKNDLNGKEEYSVLALFPKGADIANLKKAAQEAIMERWGTDQKKWPANIRSPFRKHEEKQYEADSGAMVFPAGMEAGGIFMNFKTSQKPGLIDQKKQDIINESEFYPGCWARATVRPYTYGGPGTNFTPGVAFGLRNLQKCREGDALGSKTKPQDDFEAIEGASDASAHAPSADSLFG